MREGRVNRAHGKRPTALILSRPVREAGMGAVTRVTKVRYCRVQA